MVEPRSTKTIPMILLFVMTMLTKLFCVLTAPFSEGVGLTDVYENDFKDTPHNKRQKQLKYEKPPQEKIF